MSSINALKFYITPEHECSYLPNMQATTLFANPYIQLNNNIYSDLTQLGFRRSGDHIYKPQCNQCNACIPSRIPVTSSIRKRKHRRVWTKNEDLKIDFSSASFELDDYQLYEQYMIARHNDGDMFPPSREQYESFLLSKWSRTLFIRFYLNRELICVAVADQLNDGLSAVYTFFNPAHASRSLGIYAVLYQISMAKDLNLPYVYLGYLIKNCQKMRYKEEFKPLESLCGTEWKVMN